MARSAPFGGLFVQGAELAGGASFRSVVKSLRDLADTVEREGKPVHETFFPLRVVSPELSRKEQERQRADEGARLALEPQDEGELADIIHGFGEDRAARRAAWARPPR